MRTKIYDVSVLLAPYGGRRYSQWAYQGTKASKTIIRTQSASVVGTLSEHDLFKIVTDLQIDGHIRNYADHELERRFILEQP